MFNRKAAALLLTLAMLLGCIAPALAEAPVDLSSAMPLVDVVISAAVRVGETPESVPQEGYLSPAFVRNFLILSQGAGIGADAGVLGDTKKQDEFLRSIFIPNLPDLTAIQASNDSFDYIGLKIISQTYNEETGMATFIGDVYEAEAPINALTPAQLGSLKWLDLRALVVTAPDTSSPCGWRILSFDLASDAIMDVVNEYVSDVMMEYINPEAGFSVLYPSLLGENCVDDENGVSSSLEDGSASFFARRADADGKTLDQVMAAVEGNVIRTSVDPISLCGRVDTLSDDGTTVVHLYIIFGDALYEAQLSYASSLALDFSLYSEYMMNSFNADEIGLG